MKLCYILIFTIFTNIYSALPTVCNDEDGNPVAAGACTDALCGSGKKTYNNKCYTATKVANCETINPNHDECYKCKDGFGFNANNECELSYCTTPNNVDSNKCDSCNGGFTKSNNVCTCSGKIIGTVCAKENCLSYDVSGDCNRCNEGFYINSGACAQCPSGKTSLGTGTADTSCYSIVDGCKTYTSGDCTECVFGKYLKATTSTVNGASVTTYSCVDCNDGEKVLNAVLKCKTNNDNTTSVTSQVGNCVFYLSGTTCGRCNDYSKLTSSTQCDACYYPQVSYNGIYCYTPARTEHCSSFDYSSNTCDECEAGYKTNLAGICTKVCQDCETCTPETKPSGEASNANSMKLNIIFMAIIMMFIA